MEGFAAAVEASGLATLLRQSRWSYPAVSTLHIIGLALLFGSIAPMDLRLIGVWRRDAPLGAVVDLLRPVAAAGAALALITGALLFSVQAKDYVALPLFWVKLALVALGSGHALWWGRRLASAPRGAQRLAGLLSLATWFAVITCGRLLGYL